MAAVAQKRAPSLFVSHGGGPFAVLEFVHHKEMVKLCEDSRWVFDGVKGIIVFTAHWETDTPHISHGPNPGLWHDYLNDPFAKQLPEDAWKITYPAKGDVQLAEAVKAKFDEHVLNPVLDDERGWDHGVWVPLKLLRPEADLPIVQVSIPNTRDAGTEAAFQWGAALESLRDQGYMILGSGSSYHNFGAVIQGVIGQEAAPKIPSNRGFEEAMKEAATTADPVGKWEKVAHWRRDFPDSDAVQPVGKSEHFLPFIICLGAGGGDVGSLVGEWTLFSTIMSFWRW